jgi:hypothetical protein
VERPTTPKKKMKMKMTTMKEVACLYPIRWMAELVAV